MSLAPLIRTDAPWFGPMSRATVLGGAIAMALPGTVYRTHEHAVDAALHRVELNAALLEDRLRLVFEGADHLLMTVLDAIERAAPGGHDTAALGSVIRHAASHYWVLDGIVVLDRDGTVSHNTRSPDSVGLKQDGADYFDSHRERKDLGFFVGTARQSWITGQWVIPVSRRIGDSKGEFAGVIAGDVTVASLAAFAENLDLGENRVVAVLRSDGILLFRQPESGQVGRSFVQGPPFRPPLSEVKAANYRLHALSDGVERLYAFRRLHNLPLVALTAMSVADAFQEWRRDLGNYVALWLLSLSALTIVTWFASKEASRRAAAERKIRQANRQVQLIMDHTVDGLITIDPKGTVSAFNRAAETIFGYAAHEVIGRNVNMLMPEPYGSLHDGYLAAYLGGGPPKVIGSGRQVEGLRKDGAVFPLDLAVGEIISDDGSRSFVGTVRDISERAATEAQLRQAQKMEAVGQLTGGIAHDFNNLLAVVQGNLEIVEEYLDRESPARASTAVALRASRRGADLTRRLLAFSRRMPLRPEAVEAVQLVQEVLDLMARLLGETIVVVSPNIGRPAWVLADRGQLESALVNLVLNARDAMPRGGFLLVDVESGASATSACGQPQTRIVVSDTGLGMPPDILSRVFEPFFTTKPPGKGSGLGLSMVYGFVSQSGGRVDIDSVVGKGTTVTIRLPAAEAPVEPASGSAPEFLDIGGADQVVLLVEDDNDVRATVERQLIGLRYRVLPVADGAAAIAKLELDRSVGLVLTDVTLPGTVDGTTVAFEALRIGLGVGVVCMTGYAENREKLEDLAQEGIEFLAKPFGRAQLGEALLRARQSATGRSGFIRRTGK